MPTYKTTWFFDDPTYNIGWTESWWCNGTNASSAQATVALYGSKRLACLMDTSRLVNTRCSMVGKPRDATYFAPSSAIHGSIPSAGNPLAGVWDCLLCHRDIDASTVLGHFFMHMVPASIFQGRLFLFASALPAAWLTAYLAFQTEITSGAYYLRTKSAGNVVYVSCTRFGGDRRTTRKLGRPFDALHGRRPTSASGLAPAVMRANS
jgi:hypothetical protein